MDSKELEVRPSQALSAHLAADWEAPAISTQDIIIPKILPMQGLSVAVAEGRAQMGEFRDSLNNTLLGTITSPVHLIPFFMDKAWDILEEQADGSFKWAKTVPVVENPASADYNDNWKWEAEVNGIKVKNVRRFNFYMLRPEEVADGSSVPYIFSFKSTSIKEGKKLFTQMYMRNIKAGLPPAAYTIKVGGVRQKNDKGIFIVPQYTIDRKATPEELQECLMWIKTIKSGRVKVDNSDTQETEAEATVVDSGTAEF
jgi:hypothetical protein